MGMHPRQSTFWLLLRSTGDLWEGGGRSGVESQGEAGTACDGGSSVALGQSPSLSLHAC